MQADCTAHSIIIETMHMSKLTDHFYHSPSRQAINMLWAKSIQVLFH